VDARGEEASEAQAYSEGPKLAFEEYSVLFTNPLCAEYRYAEDAAVTSVSGEPLVSKPKGAFCTNADAAASADQEGSPQRKLLGWIADSEVNEIFLAFLSFSNSAVADALCAAIEQRNVKVTMVLDRETGLSAANRVLACQPQSGSADRAPRLELRGHDGTIGFAHNKVFLFNPRSERPRIVFSSGNLSTGLTLHHENWHFVRVSGQTHFAQAHVCLMDGMLDRYRTKREYGDFIKQCREAIAVGEESDIKTFFVPGDGGRAGQHIRRGVEQASGIDVVTHRFGYRLLRDALERRLSAPNPPEVRFVADDDLWWAGQGEAIGPNTAQEFGLVSELTRLGMTVRYLETNPGIRQLQHNKFIVFEGGDAPAVFAGAGNLTGTAFTDNFENFYFIKIPKVVEAMRAQYTRLHDELATAPEDLPSRNVLPRREE
jgi:hypothetical protein